MLAVEPHLHAHNLQEYSHIFKLPDFAVGTRVLDCHAGFSNFNVQMTAQGAQVVSIDALYGMSFDEISEQLFLFDNDRQIIAREFMNDFKLGIRQGRYRADVLPFLPFEDNSFDFAICMDLVASSSADLMETYYIAAILELARVAHEVRVFPLDCHGLITPTYLEHAMAMLHKEGLILEPIVIDIEDDIELTTLKVRQS